MRTGVAVAAALLLVGCQYDPFAHEFTKAQPQESAVVGLYVPDRETTKHLRDTLRVTVHHDASLIINADHTFVARELPNFWIGHTFDCVTGGIENWSGTWSVRRDQEWWAVYLHITSRNGQPTSYQLPAMLRRERPPYLLHLTIGDPDSGDAFAFERR